MEVIVAKKAGFCFGVEKAVSTAFSSCEEYKAKGIPYSPYLIYQPEEVKAKDKKKKQEEDFDYYKRHILLESYDELKFKNDITQRTVIARGITKQQYMLDVGNDASKKELMLVVKELIKRIEEDEEKGK